MSSIPDKTIAAFARSISAEATRYGFGQLDTIRLINALMDQATGEQAAEPAMVAAEPSNPGELSVGTFPLQSSRLQIRKAEANGDEVLLEQWLADEYGRHFLLSCSTAHRADVASVLRDDSNEIGIVLGEGGKPIGAMAFLGINKEQRRAELRKLIGDRDYRGQGYAEEATRLWIAYGWASLNLEKIFVSTLQTHLRNIRLNEAVGFRVEGVLNNEVRIAGERFDVLRMGLCVADDKD